MKTYRVGDEVAVRSFQEIARTLDGTGCLEHLPFMPEMQAFCGQNSRIDRRLEKTCVEAPAFAFKRLRNVVLLDGLECNGAAHDGCHRACKILWKEAWLRPATRVTG